LSDEQAAIATKSCRRQNFNIQGATGSAKCCCCITKAHLKLGSWAGYHEFVIANPVNKHDVILGRDFLKANDALIDHGNDSITLNGAIIHINAITCIESVPSNIDVYDELDQFAAALQTLDVNTLDLSTRMLVVDSQSLKPNTQNLVRLAPATPFTQSNVTLLFEPDRPMPHNLLIGCSAHVSADQLLCNVVNASPYIAELKAGQVIGSVSVIDDANAQFDEMVSNFSPLDVEKVRITATTQPFTYSEQLLSMTANSQLNDLQRRMLLVVLKIHENVFQWDSNSLGRTKLLEHQVKTTGPPVQQRQYPIPTVAMEEISPTVTSIVLSGKSASRRRIRRSLPLLSMVSCSNQM